jgi:predicted nucleic acid-binding protein
MAGAVLVDSTYYIWHQRRDLDPFVALNAAPKEHEIVTCGMVIFEVLRGAQTDAVLQPYRSAFALLINIPTTSAIWEHAARIAWELDRRGTPIPPQDSLIAAHAIQVGASMLTFDKHFSLVPGLIVLDSFD